MLKTRKGGTMDWKGILWVLRKVVELINDLLNGGSNKQNG
jgi:hypothetical protein